jgi:hypothetical protein
VTELEIVYMGFIDIMKEWWQHENFFQKDTKSRENDPLRKNSEKVNPNSVAKMSTRKSKIHYSNRSVNENPDYRLLSSKTI